VKLSSAGQVVAVLAIALVVGAAGAFAGLLHAVAGQRGRAAAFAANGRVLEAEILSVRRGDGSQRNVRYRFEVSGRTVEGSTRLRARPALIAGGRLAIMYLPDTPEVHYVRARGLRSLPFWLVPFIPLVLLSGALIAHRALRLQRRLLEYGRPVVAAVTATKKQRHQHGSYFTVTYEFTLMNGSSRRGSYSVQKHPPETGAPVVVIYDRDRPARNRRYPIALARVALDR
jgi:hypothetical protein